jgi:hypothetical protein
MQNSKCKITIQKPKFKKYILNVIVFISLFLFVQKVWAVSFVFETKKDYFKEKEFGVKIKIDPKDEIVTVINFALLFDPTILEPNELKIENSIISFWVEKPKVFENKISFSGGIPGGFRGLFLGTALEANELIKINFKKKKEISQEELEKSFNLLSEVFLAKESQECATIKDFSFKEEDVFKENFNFLSGILYNGIRWKVEKVF